MLAARKHTHHDAYMHAVQRGQGGREPAERVSCREQEEERTGTKAERVSGHHQDDAGPSRKEEERGGRRGEREAKRLRAVLEANAAAAQKREEALEKLRQENALLHDELARVHAAQADGRAMAADGRWNGGDGDLAQTMRRQHAVEVAQTCVSCVCVCVDSRMQTHTHPRIGGTTPVCD